MMLDPNTVQVLFADLQLQIVARSKTNTPDALARSAAVLACRSHFGEILFVIHPEAVDV